MQESDSAGASSTSSVVAPGAVKEAPGLGRRTGSGRKWLIIGAIAVALILVIGYVLGGAAAAGGPISRADAALQTTVSHDQSIGNLFSKDPFQSVNFNGSDQEVTSAKVALAKAKSDLLQWQADVSKDRAALLKARAALTTSLLTLPEQGTINDHRRRVDAALRAMSDAQLGIDRINKQLDVLAPFFDAVGGFIGIGKAADANDLNGMQRQLASTMPNMQKAVTLGQASSLPQPMMAVLNSMQQMLADMKGLISAAQAGDQAGTQRYGAAITTDGKALDTTDQTAIDNAEKRLFQPLSDDYEREMKIAAGS